MSSIANLSSAPSALSAITTHSHGHKKGSRVESTSSNSDGDAMTPVPAGTQQNLFSSMLQSLEQVIGVQPASSASASTGTAAAGSITASTRATAASTTPAAAATATSSAALQKYLNKVSSQTNDVKFPTVAGSNVSVNVNA
jgi:hypothetical protein